MIKNYKIVTLCGSTRFKEQFMETQKRLTLSVHLDEDVISELSCQFPVPADYDGEGTEGSRFVFFL